MDFPQILGKLCDRRDLCAEEAEFAMSQLMRGSLSPAQAGAFLAALKTKGESAGEIGGLARVMRKHATKICPKAMPLLDTCGTGGDFSHSFNVSTTSAIIASACGIAVAKHGNRSATSKCGSADVLEALGFAIGLAPAATEKMIDETGFGFLFAPAYHPAMKFAGPVRKELGIKTVFNLLGPLSNPAGATRQLLGVYDEKLCEPIALALRGLGTEHALVVHGGGMDEIAVAGETKISELKNGNVQNYSVFPEEFGFARASAEELMGGDAAQNAAIIIAILSGEDGGAKRDMALLNAGAAIYAGGKSESIAGGVSLAEKSVDSGKALAHLRAVIGKSKELAEAK
ncbi:MAG: anthranilate phosphoribosyltransferase [Candidatus Micrarchaeia archaeon]|jgi:anthranilate phosphoribosyltransferase